MKLTPIICVLLFAFVHSAAQTAIDTAEAIPVGNIEQYITIKSKDRSLPLLLFLHGGPGGSVLRYADKFTYRLQQHFVVIQWDQRGTGRTQELCPSPTALSLDVFQKDAHDMIRVLLKKFGRDKLYLVGHSWGTALGFHVARNYPGLLYAYIPIGAMVWQSQSEKMALAMMKKRALTDENAHALDELSTVDIPFQDGEKLFYHRKWLQEMSGNRKMLSKSYVEKWALTWLPVFNEASAENLFTSAPQIDCPVYFMAGRTDCQTNSSLAEKYYLMLRAPKKGFFWFERCGHSVPTCEPDRLQAIIVETILPETFTIPRGGTVISDQ